MWIRLECEHGNDKFGCFKCFFEKHPITRTEYENEEESEE